MNFVDILINGILAFVMLSVGLSLEWEQFKRTFARPKSFLLGLSLRMIYLPLLAFCVIVFTDLPVEFKVGIIILASVPEGMTSNFIVYLFDANAALSISVIVFNNLLALLSIPFIVNLALVYFMGENVEISLPFWDTMRQIFIIVIIPVIVGLLLRRYYHDFADRVQVLLKWVTMVLLAILFGIKFFASENMGGSGITLNEIWTILPFSIIINFLALASGYFAGKLFKTGEDDSLALGVILGIQNTSLAFLIAGTLLRSEAMLKPALVYSTFTFFTAVIFGALIKPGSLKALLKRK